MTNMLSDDRLKSLSLATAFKQLIETEGLTPRQAVDRVLELYELQSTPLAVRITPLLFEDAKEVERSKARETRKWALQQRLPVPRTPSAVVAIKHERQQAISTTVFHMPDGKRILWGDLRIQDLNAKIAWMRAHVGTIMDHLKVLEKAQQLITERGVERLGDVPNWADLIRAHMVGNGHNGPTAIEGVAAISAE